MMRALTELVTEGRVDSHVGYMVHSVHELRNGNWGQSSNNSVTVESTVELLDPNQAIDEPVLYGPDGKVLTPEENKFLEQVPDSTTNIEDHMYVFNDCIVVHSLFMLIFEHLMTNAYLIHIHEYSFTITFYMYEYFYSISEQGYEGEETWMSEDDDIDAAYEEFLKNIPKQIKNQTQK